MVTEAPDIASVDRGAGERLPAPIFVLLWIGAATPSLSWVALFWIGFALSTQGYRAIDAVWWLVAPGVCFALIFAFLLLSELRLGIKHALAAAVGATAWIAVLNLVLIVVWALVIYLIMLVI
ncbi:MAG: hypothetical protein AAGD00_00385 [Planctomycetota bacterium]